MNSKTSFDDLSPDLTARIEAALAHYAGPFGVIRIVPDGVMLRRGRRYVPVSPDKYPRSFFSFLDAIARAEIELRDSGEDVTLTPAIKQRMVVVASLPPDGKEFLYLSTDGNEFDDLARLLELRGLFDITAIEAFAYDDPEELAGALEQARNKHPKAEVLGSLDYPDAA